MLEIIEEDVLSNNIKCGRGSKRIRREVKQESEVIRRSLVTQMRV